MSNTPSVQCFAFQERSGAIDVESIGESQEVVRTKMLQACMGWRYAYPDMYSHDEEWICILGTGDVVPVTVSAVNA